MAWSAMYPGVCERCGGTVAKGQRVDWSDVEERTIQHETCPKQSDPCPLCHLVHAGECF